MVDNGVHSVSPFLFIFTSNQVKWQNFRRMSRFFDEKIKNRTIVNLISGTNDKLIAKFGAVRLTMMKIKVLKQ